MPTWLTKALQHFKGKKTSDPTSNPTSNPAPNPTSHPTLNPTTNPTSNRRLTLDLFRRPTRRSTRRSTPAPNPPNPPPKPAPVPTPEPSSEPPPDPTPDSEAERAADPPLEPTPNPTLDPEQQIYDDVVWETPALRSLWRHLVHKLGDLTDVKVLDVACNTSRVLREARTLGATRVVGVDFTKDWIKLCKPTAEDTEQIELHVTDEPVPLDHMGIRPASFDLVIGLWLFHFAFSAEVMERFWSDIATYLKPGGTVVGIIQNQGTIRAKSVATLKYGVRATVLDLLDGGEGVKMHMEFDTQPKVHFDTYVLKLGIFESAAAKAGMINLRCINPGHGFLTAEEQENIGWWQELLDEQPNQLVVADKPLYAVASRVARPASAP